MPPAETQLDRSKLHQPDRLTGQPALGTVLSPSQIRTWHHNMGNHFITHGTLQSQFIMTIRLLQECYVTVNFRLQFSQQLGTLLRETGSNACPEIQVTEVLLVDKTADQIRKPIAHAIEIGSINLMDIPGKNNFCTLSAACYDRFYIKRTQVLSLVNNKIPLRKAPPPDIGQCFNLKQASIY